MMNTDTSGQQLHDRATRGETLSAEERAQLAEWYARLDREEAAVLARALPAGDLASLAAQIESSVVHLATVTQRIQVLAEKNREATLSPEEAEELDSYVNVGDLVAILQSKARKLLKCPPSGPDVIDEEPARILAPPLERPRQ